MQMAKNLNATLTVYMESCDVVLFYAGNVVSRSEPSK
jgi:hypothetical protein